MSQGKLAEPDYTKAVEMAFKHFDKNNDNFLNKEEFSNMYAAIGNQLQFELTEQIMDFLFKQIDADKDGKVSFNDLLAALKIFYYK